MNRVDVSYCAPGSVVVVVDGNDVVVATVVEVGGATSGNVVVVSELPQPMGIKTRAIVVAAPTAFRRCSMQPHP